MTRFTIFLLMILLAPVAGAQVLPSGTQASLDNLEARANGRNMELEQEIRAFAEDYATRIRGWDRIQLGNELIKMAAQNELQKKMLETSEQINAANEEIIAIQDDTREVLETQGPFICALLQILVEYENLFPELTELMAAEFGDEMIYPAEMREELDCE